MNKAAIVERLNPMMDGKSPGEIISIARQELAENLMMTTAFGYSGIVLLSFVNDIFPEIPIYFIDTSYHFEETLKLRKKINSEWNIDIQMIQSRRSESELESLMGKDAITNDPDMCCHYRKVEPLQNLMNPDTIWLSATRRDQSVTRKNTRPIEIDGRGQIKISPLYNWTREECWTYIRKYALPYNPLHDQFYPSIGCYPCTNPIDEGGDERSGRWSGSDKIECGLHINIPPKSL